MVGSRGGGGFFVDVFTNSAYIFGGFVLRVDVPSPRLTSDVWKCDFSRDQGVSWTWIHGSNQYNDPGIYTEIGDQNSVVYPSARYSYAQFYDHDSRKFYMFGGYGLDNSGNEGALGDHWSYNVDSNSFVWLGGSNQASAPSNYTIGVESASNKIGGLYAPAFVYSHARKEFFIFGGATENAFFNIIWRYKASNNMFTALSGDTNIEASVIISFGELHPGNMPSGRAGSSVIVTGEGKIYVFGGAGYFPLIDYEESLVYSATNELWVYDLDSNMWALVAGSKYANNEGIFSNDPTIACPGSRLFFNLLYDYANNAALFQGGRNLGYKDSTLYSDEWIFNLTSHEWTYIRGHDLHGEPATYGSYRVPNPDNRPGWRYLSSVYYAENEAYLFGGAAHGDLWKVSFSGATASATTSTTASASITTTTTSDYSTTAVEATTEFSETLSSSPGIASTNDVSTTSESAITSTTTTVPTTAEPSFETSSSTMLVSTLSNEQTLTWSTIDITTTSASSTFYVTQSISHTTISSTLLEAITISAPSTMEETRTTSHTTLSPALPETTQVATPAPELTSTWVSSHVSTSETSTKEAESSTLALFSSTVELSYSSTKTVTSHLISSSSVSVSITAGPYQNSSIRGLSSKDSSKSTLKAESNFEQQRSLDPSIIILIAVIAAILLLISLVVLCFCIWRRNKTYFTHSRAFYYKSTAILPIRSYSYELPSLVNGETTRGDTTFMGANGELLSIPAYLEVSKTSFRITTKLSHGGAGDIFLADALDERTNMFGNTIVIKTLRSFDGRISTDKHMKLIEQELSIMAMFRNHKNIAKMVGFCREDNYYILMKYYRIGSLDKFLRDASNHISKQLILSFISDICAGIQALHQKELAHSDIKSANILIDDDDDGYAFCVLTDFGITQVLSLSHVVNGFNITNITGLSTAYASPEAFARKSAKRGFTDKPAVFKAGDVYSMGSIMFELMTRNYPWS
ncbi:hypothetical protein MP638_004108 [Amoeboaphelidium occidentale]|nr:hypothetical protein MP638_004108 [Amoeboaphelidium occidentale]